MGAYTARVEADIAKAKTLMEAVHKESVQRTIDIMQTPVGAGGNMPIDTGFLRASGTATTSTSAPAGTENPGEGAFSYDGSAVSLMIAGASLDQPVTFWWTANYARPANYGARGRPGRKFRDLGAQLWPQTVAAVAAEAKARAGG